MKIFNYLLISFALIVESSSLIPVWDIKNSSFDLLEKSNSVNISIYEKIMNGQQNTLNASLT